MGYHGRTPDSRDAQINDEVTTFLADGSPMVRGGIRASWPKGYGYRDLDMTPEEAEKVALSLLRAAERARVEARSATLTKARVTKEAATLEANVAFYARIRFDLLAIARSLNVSPIAIENTQAWKAHVAKQEEAA